MTDNIRSEIAAWVDSEYGSCPVAGTQLLAFIDSQQAKVAELKAERDELIAALQGVAQMSRCGQLDQFIGEPWLNSVFAAIAKAGGKTE